MISRLPKWVWLGGGLLAFCAGTINVIALLGFAHKAATHITGIVSLFSIGFMEGKSEETAQTLTMLISFFMGAVISGLIIRDGHLRMGRRYGGALSIESIMLLLATYGFVHRHVWGEYFACMAAGLQNAMASTYSGTIVRTTHLTGILTDLGGLFGNRLVGVPVDNRRVKLLSGILFSFLSGGLFGVYCYQKLEAWAMLVPAGIIGLCALAYEVLRRKLDDF
jgi:uncharacterized membrane protein YoaK (UPF0700 family)